MQLTSVFWPLWPQIIIAILCKTSLGRFKDFCFFYCRSFSHFWAI